MLEVDALSSVVVPGVEEQLLAARDADAVGDAACVVVQHFETVAGPP